MLSKIKIYFRDPNLLGVALLKRCQFLPDKLYLKLRYRLEMGEKLNLKNPQTFQEKLQWLKLYDRKPIYTAMVDKYAAKQYVADRIGDEYIIPTLGVWSSFDDIDFDKLPDQFVLKTTHGGGSTGVVVCKNKDDFDKEQARIKLTRSLEINPYDGYREWPYKGVPRRIICEQYIKMPAKQDLTDYKIFCFGGEPRYIQVIQDRTTKETIDFLDKDWTHQEFYGLNPKCRPSGRPIGRPEGLEKMLEIAKELSRGTKFLRVDLYNIDGEIKFGEMTFYPASGIGTFTPSEWNKKMGDLIKL